ncbi:MAG: DNA polymerase III subunit delta [Burkholderiaceae bacterium]
MLIKPEQISQALQRGLPPAAWVHGEEALLVLESTDQIRAAAREAGFTERIVMDADRYFKPEQWQQEAGALSLFAERKIIEIRVPAKPKRDLIESLAHWLGEADNSDVFVLISSGRPEPALLKSAPFKTIESKAMVVQSFPIAYRDLPGWIAVRLRAQDQQADRELLRLIAERVEGNLLAASQEIRKLGLLFPAGELPADEAAAAVLEVARFEATDLVDAILSADAARAKRCVEGMKSAGQADVMVIWQLADCARGLLRLREVLDRGQTPGPDLYRQIRAWGPRQRLYEQGARRIRTEQARLALTDAAQADTMAKGFRRGDSWHLIDRITLRLAGFDPLPAPLPSDL